MRERCGSSATKAQVLSKIAAISLQNEGCRKDLTLEGKAVEEFNKRHGPSALENRYRYWTEWTKTGVHDWKLRILGASGRTKPVTVAAAEALTQSLASEYFRNISAFLSKVEVGKYLFGQSTSAGAGFEITSPQHLWVLDEKGFTDEGLSCLRTVATAGGSRIRRETHPQYTPHPLLPREIFEQLTFRAARGGCLLPPPPRWGIFCLRFRSIRISKHARSSVHISVLTIANAAGQVAPPAIAIPTASMHAGLERLWPNAH